MGAVTYPDDKVVDFVMNRMVPLQVPSDSPLAADFDIKWTPTVIVLDYYGKEHNRTVGFLPPEELIASLLLGMGKIDFDTEQFSAATNHFEALLKAYPLSAAAPEAVYLGGVSRFKSTHDPSLLKDAYERLKAEYPASEWVKRAEPYSLL